MLPSFLFAFAVMIPMGYAHRFWHFNSIMPYAILGGFAINALVEWLGRKFQWKQHAVVLAVGVLLVAITLDPVLGPPGMHGPGGPPIMGPGADRRDDTRGEMPRISLQPTAISRMLGSSPGPGRNLLQVGQTDELVEMIEEHTESQDIVSYGMGPMACLVTAMTGRRTNSGMLHEVSSEEQTDNLDDVNVLILQTRTEDDTPMSPPPGAMMGPGGFGGRRPRQGNLPMRQGPNAPGAPGFQPPGGMMGPGPLGMQGNPPKDFELVAESDGISLYRNPEASTYEIPKPDPVLTLPLILLLIAGIAGFVAIDMLRPRVKRTPFLAAFFLLSVICIVACLPIISAAFNELADQPTRPEWLERRPPRMGPPGPGMMGPGMRPLPPDVPRDIAEKHRELMSHVREEIQAGRRPDYFLPFEKGRQIHDLIQQRRYDDTGRLITEALQKYHDSPDRQAK